MADLPRQQLWPPLPLADWQDTYATLHMWTQVVGKIRLARAPYLNHTWNVPLYVTPRGLGTGIMPHGDRPLSILFDFLDHQLLIDDCHGGRRSLPLKPMTVADFYAATMATLDEMNLPVKIWPMPVEVANPIRFDHDTTHRAYDPAAVARLHRILLNVNSVFEHHRGRFVGKSSPVHFFWGAFDLAVTRFSGRPNPNPPPDPVMGDAYSHEVISHGFWPGGDWPSGGRIEDPVFYAYAVPEPAGFREATAEPAAARYSEKLGEYLLDYEAVRQAADPAAEILAFMTTTYAAAATAAGWDRASLERAEA